MKYYSPILVLISVIFITGCLPKSKDQAQLPVPSGTFKGEFRRLHRKIGQVKFDTLKINLTLTMATPGNTFAVTGDTAALHAGSHGTFSIGPQYMQFTDVTYPKINAPLKTHLAGGYIYNYDGTIFQLEGFSVDTLVLQYDLKRSQ